MENNFHIFPLKNVFFGENVRISFCKIPPSPPGGGDGDGGIISQGVQAHVPLRPGMKYSRKGKPLTPMKIEKIANFRGPDP